MKKTIVALSIAAVVCTAVTITAVSTDFFSTDALFEKDGSSKDAARAEITISVGDGLLIKEDAKYDHSIAGKDGRVIDFYTAENGNEYAVDDEGDVVLGYFEGSGEEKTTLLKSNDEARALALKWMGTLTDDVSRFTEKNLRVRGTGENKKYNFDYYEYLCGYPTENAVSVTLDAYGNMTSFYCKDDVDYSGLDTASLENITDDELYTFATEKLQEKYPEGYKSIRITSKWLAVTGNVYYLNLGVEIENNYGTIGSECVEYIVE